MTPAPEESRIRLRPRAIDAVDVLVNLTVLSLFVQFAPTVISESFVVSLVTAVLMKLVLELVVPMKQFFFRRFRTAATSYPRIVAVGSFLVVSFAGRYLLIKLTELVLGDAVHLGGFWEVTMLIVTLIGARWAVRRVLLDD